MLPKFNFPCVCSQNFRRTFLFLTDLAFKSRIVVPAMMYMIFTAIGVDIQIQFRARERTEDDSSSEDSESDGAEEELSVNEDGFE